MLHVGGCGTNIGAKVWEAIMPEHGLDAQGIVASDATVLQRELLDIYFQESRGGRYVPRAVLVDSEPGNLDRIRAGDSGQLFKSDNYINSRGTSGGLFSKGYYEVGPELVDEVMDAVRKEMENTDGFQGFQLTRSICGGTGSGLGSFLLGKLYDEFGYGNSIQTFDVAPNKKTCESLTEHYNAVLCLGRSMKNPSTLFDNEGIIEVLKHQLGIKKPSLGDINRLIAKSIAGFTSAIRFPGIQNATMNKIHSNLIPFPRLCLSIMSHTLSNQSSTSSYGTYDGDSLTSEAFNPHSFLSSVDPRHGRYITAFASYRGNIPSSVVQEQIKNVQSKNSSYFVEWIPNNVTMGFGFPPPKESEASVTLMANTTAVQELLKRSTECFSAMFRRKGFVCWYTSSGLSEMEFTSCESNLNDMVSEYQQYQDATADDGDQPEE